MVPLHLSQSLSRNKLVNLLLNIKYTKGYHTSIINNIDMTDNSCGIHTVYDINVCNIINLVSPWATPLNWNYSVLGQWNQVYDIYFYLFFFCFLLIFTSVYFILLIFTWFLLIFTSYLPDCFISTDIYFIFAYTYFIFTDIYFVFADVDFIFLYLLYICWPLLCFYLYVPHIYWCILHFYLCLLHIYWYLLHICIFTCQMKCRKVCHNVRLATLNMADTKLHAQAHWRHFGQSSRCVFPGKHEVVKETRVCVRK